jgi:tetratricopeptide (TPR) repeat protein
MNGDPSDSRSAKASGGEMRRIHYTILAVICTLIIGVYGWNAESGFLDFGRSPTEDSYYNLLVQGFRDGQLNVKREAPPGLSKLANPYDPAINDSYVWDKNYLSYEMSYYQGKLYLYFGVTPALALFWPYVALTGHYLSHKSAVVVFFGLGFLIAAGLIRAVWRRYFPEVNVWVVAAGVLTLGLATGILGNLSSCDVHQVPISCGYAFTMLALGAIWCALHEPKRQVLWLLLGSLAYGLAIGSRPSLLFGVIILLLPVVQAWRGAAELRSRRRIGLLLVAAVGPVMLVGLGLMLYNALRFDNPFEFGWHYQLTSYQNSTAQIFSLHYLWVNLRFYFLEPVRWSGHFPFMQAWPLPSLPSGYYGFGSPCSGILSNSPVVWLALAAPLVWRGRPVAEVSTLRWFITAEFILFAICALTLCLFFSASSSYALDFLPVLMVLTVMGIFGLERALVGLPVWRRLVRCGWSLLLVYTLVFNTLASVKAHAAANFFVANSFASQGRVDEAIERFQKALALEPKSAPFHIRLADAYYKTGRVNEAMNELQKALEIQPNYASAHNDLGAFLIMQGRSAEAIEHLQKALKIQPGNVDFQINLAWVLATDPDASLRNGDKAIELAQQANQSTGESNPDILRTLAAAYAEGGRYSNAVATAQRALAQAVARNYTNPTDALRREIELYRVNRPFHH